MSKKNELLIHLRWVSPQSKARSTRCLTRSPPHLMPHPNTIGKTEQKKKSAQSDATFGSEKNKYKRETEWTLKINCWPNFWKITFSASCCCAQIGFKIQSWPDNLSILSTASEHKMFLEKKKIHISLKILLLCHRLSLQSPRAICFFPRRA